MVISEGCVFRSFSIELSNLSLFQKSVFVNATGTACLGNFGLRNLGMVDISQFDEGLRWQAPELMDELRDGDLSCPTKASDVYSAASVMYEVCIHVIS